MGEWIAAADLLPDLVLSSPAERASETARLAAEAGGFADRVETVEALYGTDPEGCLEILADRAAGRSRMMLVGHNPTASDLVELLADRRRPLATGALARLEFDLDDWPHLGRGTGRLVEVRSPGS